MDSCNENKYKKNLCQYDIIESFSVYRSLFLGLLYKNYHLLLDNNIRDVNDMYLFVKNTIIPKMYLPEYQWFTLINNALYKSEDYDHKEEWKKYVDWCCTPPPGIRGCHGMIIIFFAIYMNIHIICINNDMTYCNKYMIFNELIKNSKCTFTIQIIINDKINHMEFINTDINIELLNDHNFKKLYKSYLQVRMIEYKEINNDHEEIYNKEINNDHEEIYNDDEEIYNNNEEIDNKNIDNEDFVICDEGFNIDMEEMNANIIELLYL